MPPDQTARSAADDGAAARLAAALPNGLAAIVFDMDGTLLDTERLHHAANGIAAEALRLDVDAAVFDAMVGVHRDRCREMLADRFGPDFPLDAFYSETDRHFRALAADGIPHRPGVVAMLDRLRRHGIPIAIATSTTSPMAQGHLAAAGLLDRFDVIVTRTDVEHPKPAPDPYRLAAKRLGVDPADCLAVEDSPNGVRSAAAAGMVTVMIPDMIAPDAEMRHRTVAIFDTLSDVLRALEASVLTPSSLSSSRIAR